MTKLICFGVNSFTPYEVSIYSTDRASAISPSSALFTVLTEISAITIPPNSLGLVSLQFYSLALAILIYNVSGPVNASSAVSCALPTFDNVALLTWSYDQADNTSIREWPFWLSYRDEKRNVDTEKAIQGVMGITRIRTWHPKLALPNRAFANSPSR